MQVNTREVLGAEIAVARFSDHVSLDLGAWDEIHAAGRIYSLQIHVPFGYGGEAEFIWILGGGSGSFETNSQGNISALLREDGSTLWSLLEELPSGEESWLNALNVGGHAFFGPPTRLRLGQWVTGW